MSKLEVPGTGLKVGGEGLTKLVEIEAKIEIKLNIERTSSVIINKLLNMIFLSIFTLFLESFRLF